jgi:hypothetical protein
MKRTLRALKLRIGDEIVVEKNKQTGSLMDTHENVYCAIYRDCFSFNSAPAAITLSSR